MATAYLALGSNLGDRWAISSAAVRRLRAEPGLRVVAVSAFYETAPVGCPPGSGEFLNARRRGRDRPLSRRPAPTAPAHRTQFGRVRAEPNSPRTLDLDLLPLRRPVVIDTPNLVVPHPRMHERAFVLVPLAEIARRGRSPDARQDRSGSCSPACPRPIEDTSPGVTPFSANAARHSRVFARSSPARRAGSARRSRGRSRITGRRSSRHGRRETLGAPSGRRRRPPRPGAGRPARERSVGSFGGLDVLVCNAGADTLTGEAGKWSFDEKLDALLAVDLKATMRLARDLGARMKARGRGSILTVGWDQAETGMEGDSGQLFAAVKGAVMCFTRSLALSLAPEVRVNCLAPGWIRTAWGETAGVAWQERVRRETPLGVWGLPEDVAAAAVWLASPAAGFVTGQTIRVNGGAVCCEATIAS